MPRQYGCHRGRHCPRCIGHRCRSRYRLSPDIGRKRGRWARHCGSCPAYHSTPQLQDRCRCLVDLDAGKDRRHNTTFFGTVSAIQSRSYTWGVQSSSSYQNCRKRNAFSGPKQEERLVNARAIELMGHSLCGMCAYVCVGVTSKVMQSTLLQITSALSKSNIGHLVWGLCSTCVSPSRQMILKALPTEQKLMINDPPVRTVHVAKTDRLPLWHM